MLQHGKLWTMHIFDSLETKGRFKHLLEQGQTGFSITFDLATLMGYDIDQPEAPGEFGQYKGPNWTWQSQVFKCHAQIGTRHLFFFWQWSSQLNLRDALYFLF
jgi:methylmalonyl-CoA mutase N-terminal domain/subunit